MEERQLTLNEVRETAKRSADRPLYKRLHWALSVHNGTKPFPITDYLHINKANVSVGPYEDDRITLSIEYLHGDCPPTVHRVIIRPRFDGIHVRVLGKNKNHVVDYLTDTLTGLLLES